MIEKITDNNNINNTCNSTENKKDTEKNKMILTKKNSKYFRVWKKKPLYLSCTSLLNVSYRTYFTQG